MSDLQLEDYEFDLTVYIPTKGRPDNALRLQDAFYSSVTLNTRAVFILSDNDPMIDRYRDLHFTLTVTPDKPGFVSPLNEGYWKDRKQFYSYALGFMGDDHLPRTFGWDQRIVYNLKQLGAGLVYGNDKFQEQSIPTQVFMTSDIPLALDFMTLPRLKHLYADNFWLDLGKGLNRIQYLPDVIIEHMHPAAGKAHHDAGYEFSGNFHLDQEDKATYNHYLETDLAGDIMTVEAAIRRSI